MTQTDLFTYPAHPGWKRRDTAEDAARQIAPKAATLRQAVLATLRGRGPLTADAVAGVLGESVLAIRPRCSELAALHLIADSGLRGVNASGRRAVIWRAVSVKGDF